jgi:hypothetical protein
MKDPSGRKGDTMAASQTIAPLTKVTLELTVSSGKQPENPTESTVDFDFVCGIGTQGLTAFEVDLLGKRPGERLQVHIEAGAMADYFEHLRTPILEALETEPPFDLNLAVRTVSRISPRELVYALARKGGDGGGCGCGCDCGG